MVVKKYIDPILIDIDKKYNISIVSPDKYDAIYYAKLAVLEYCGWIEESLDIIASRAIKGKVKSKKFTKILDKTIKSNYGFTYDYHFRGMMIKIVGLEFMEQLEDYLDDKNKLGQNKLVILKTELETIKEYRDKAAHTSVTGITQSFPGPSNIISRFNIIYPILRDIYSQVVHLTK